MAKDSYKCIKSLILATPSNNDFFHIPVPVPGSVGQKEVVGHWELELQNTILSKTVFSGSVRFETLLDFALFLQTWRYEFLIELSSRKESQVHYFCSSCGNRGGSGSLRDHQNGSLFFNQSFTGIYKFQEYCASQTGKDVKSAGDKAFRKFR